MASMPFRDGYCAKYRNCSFIIVGFDVVETASDKLGDVTAVVAAKIIHDFYEMQPEVNLLSQK